MFWSNPLQCSSGLKTFSNEMFVRHVSAMRYKWKKIKQLWTCFNVCLYSFGKYKESNIFGSTQTVYVQRKKQSLWNHCSQTWYISHFSPSQYEKRQQAVESTGIKCLTKLDVTVDVSFPVASMPLMRSRVRFCFSITYVWMRSSLEELWNICITCLMLDGHKIHMSYLAKKYFLMKIDIKFIYPSNEKLENVVKIVW